MAQRISNVALIVRDYHEAIAFYCGVLGFELQEDTYQPEQDKRWVVVRPRDVSGNVGTGIVLARPSSDEQEPFIGQQGGGRVFMFLATDDFDRDHADYVSKGVTFVREPLVTPYGKVAVFSDLYGNLWDLIQFADGHPLAVSER
ncbi:VOC family protein [Rhizobium sp. C4]|uniref:VOC family protein n=1 Tax=Rhizobium sp. C4 TaxID=1349800 RepID=UPI001E52A8CD|nr:VOC family protein [Rhizobium sp. C4]MCD2171406.1 VOC family protein [Rhizobium sp. C4]